MNVRYFYLTTVLIPYYGERPMPKNLAQFSVYLNPDQDKDLIDWLKAQKNVSAAIRQVLQRHLLQKITPSDAVQAKINPETLQKAVEAGIDARLGDIRRVVDAALYTAQDALPSTASALDSSEADEDELADDVDWFDSFILE